MKFVLLMAAATLLLATTTSGDVIHGVIPLVAALSEADPSATEEELVRIVEDTERKMSPERETRVFPEDVVGFAEVELPGVGTFIGQTNSWSHSFYSIPYAEAPVNELRFMPPVPKADVGTMNVSMPTNIQCFNKCNRKCPDNYREDCLILNVFVPNTVDLSSSGATSDGKLPVMFFIHGGGFQKGSANDDNFDSRLFVNYTNTIVVVVNYRLTTLGFMVYEEGDTKWEGNQGFKDQQMALKWTHTHIGSFGGDSDKIMVVGQSAGAQSALFHLLSPISRPYMARDISMSPPMVFRYDTPEESLNSTLHAIEVLRRKKTNLNCRENKTGAECLRDSDPQDVAGTGTNVQVLAFRNRDPYSLVEPFRPVIDGVEFTDQPMKLLDTGKWNNEKPFMIGTMTDELAMIVNIFRNFTIKYQLFKFLNELALGPRVAEKAVEEYSKRGDPQDPDFDWTRIITDELNDLFFTCPNRMAARFASKTASRPEPSVFMYTNAHGGKDTSCVLPDQTFFPCGYAAHATELPFLFRTGPSKGIAFDENDWIVSDMLDDFWGSFAYGGVPTSPNLLFPPYQPDSSGSWTSVQIKAPQGELKVDHMKDICDFWDGLDFYYDQSEDANGGGGGAGAIRQPYSFVLVVSIFCTALSMLFS